MLVWATEGVVKQTTVLYVQYLLDAKLNKTLSGGNMTVARN
jgi:hypothetical protein